MIVGWQLAANMRTELVLDALRMALGLREPGADFELVAHTDAGSQYTSFDYTQVLDDHQVLASIGSVGDCYDNALAESFVDSYKTELIADRVWRSRAQLELATVEWVGWFNHERLHEALGDIPPVEFEQLHALSRARRRPVSGNGSVAALSPRAADGLTTPRFSTLGVDNRRRQPDQGRERLRLRERSRSGRPSRGPGSRRRRPASPTYGSERYSLTITTSTTQRPRNPPNKSPWNPAWLSFVKSIRTG